MNEFIEKNKGLFRVYYLAARIIGWALLLLPLLTIAWMLLLTGLGGIGVSLWTQPAYPSYWRWPEHTLLYGQVDLFSPVIAFVLPGLLVLGLAQFIRYLSERNYRPGWVLRCAEGILYLYAVVLIVHAVWSNIFSSKLVVPEMNLSVVPVTISSLLITAAKATILIGLGQILARVMPVIEESKTLV
jgi:hypothetical protein